VPVPRVERVSTRTDIVPVYMQTADSRDERKEDSEHKLTDEVGLRALCVLTDCSHHG
jgi:hypothetical protein